MSLLMIAEFVDPKQEITTAEDDYLGKRISIIRFTPAINSTINSALNPRISLILMAFRTEIMNSGLCVSRRLPAASQSIHHPFRPSRLN